jgi:phosphonate transport system ATP-binding protein
MLELDGLTKAFGQTRAVQDVRLAIPAGQFVGVIGRSGAGKSTLLRMINRLAEPTAGHILWQGAEVTGLSGRKLRDWRRRCAMIFQQFNLVGRLDVLNNVLLGRLAYTPFWRAALKAWPSDDRALAFAALNQLDMGALAPRRADHLSGGQQQRVAICRALVQEPEIILADEPVASLDPRNAKIVMDALQRINRHFGLTVLCNLHSLDLARTYCDRLVGMANGRIVFDDLPAALTEDVARELYGIEADAVVGAQPTPLRAAAEAATISSQAVHA